ncbi:hypothetical protein JVU11DRAFT_1767 [Chiua virens]|nr:hypothetical protein JVU11DRAFT_1767 [Chiua virens]
MPPRRAASRSQPPAQRRPRSGKACCFCKVAKQRCESIEYGTTDQPCRRCISQGLECNLPRTTRSQSRSQSPGTGPSLSGPILHPTLQPSGGATGELTSGSQNDPQHSLPQFESAPIPMAPFPDEEREGSTTNIPFPGENPLRTSNFPPLAPSMDVYQQGFSNVAQGPSNLAPGYYPYYMTDYLTQSANDGEPDFSYVTERPGEDPQPGNAGDSTNEQVANFFRSGES